MSSDGLALEIVGFNTFKAFENSLQGKLRWTLARRASIQAAMKNEVMSFHEYFLEF